MKHIITLGIFSLLTLNFCFAQTFEDRRQQYITSAIGNPNGNAITIQAYESVTVDQSELDDIYAEMETRSTIDFQIVKLVRVMFLGGGTYDAQIVPQLNLVPYWVNYGDTLRGFWSENHMVMWMSSDWLIHERTGRPIDANLENRLKHYLQLKIDHGFYEFFSSTYAPYCLSGILNLADFSEDLEIKTLAIAAAKRLLSELLLVTNDQGVFFPAAGRNYTSKYENPYGQNHNSLIWLLTGLGEQPLWASHSGGFLATTSVDFSEVTSSWVADIDTVLPIGHSLDSGMILNQNQAHVDRMMFQWSSGAYFHPDVVTESVQLIVDSNLWEHVDFALLAPLAGQPVENYQGISEALDELSMSSVISGQNVAIFKKGNVVLTSIQDFWKGKVGYQQWPLAANVGVTAVYTASGEVDEDWNVRNRNNSNAHLPYVEQQHNVALLMYRPQEVSALLGFTDKTVALHWPDTAFDQIEEDGMWLLGRQAEGYVAARRSCIAEVNGHRACPIESGQTWVIVVGNDEMYGNFSNFQSTVTQSQFTESWNINANGDSVYYASIAMDSIWIEHYWQPLVNTGISESVSSVPNFQMWPNPTHENVKISLESFNGDVQISAVNSLGQSVYNKSISNHAQLTMPVSSWPTGLYSITIRDDEKQWTERLIKH